MRCALIPVVFVCTIIAASVPPAAGEGATPAAAEASARTAKVLLLNGFEPDVLTAWAGRRTAPGWSYVRVVRMGKDGLPYGGGMVGTLVKGDATQGAYGLLRQIPREDGRRPDHSLSFLKNENAKESIRRSVGVLLNTFGTFRDFYPKDWSAYAKLRFDIKSAGSPLRLRVEIEDALIAPPLRRVYQVPAGNWVTVEFDLAEAARLRDVRLSGDDAKRLGVQTLTGRLINLHDMANMRITIEHLEARTAVTLDNMRLVVGGAEKGETNRPILVDNRPFPVPAVLPPSKPTPREPMKGRLNRAPLDWGKPVEIPVSTKGGYGLQLMDVAPVDNDRMLMAAFTTSVLKTVDGGTTWTGLDGTPNTWTKVIDHDTNAPGRWAAAMGPDIMVLGTAKCSGGATPIDSYSVLTRFDGTDWKVQPRGLVDVDARHCPEHKVKLVRLPSGRIWACWLHYSRFAGNDICARYSDDEGQTWRDPTSNGLLRLTTRGTANPYAMTWWLERPRMPDWAPEQALGRIAPMSGYCPQIAAWGDHVMVAFGQNDRVSCSFFDGVRWGAAVPTGIKGFPASLAHVEGTTAAMAVTDGTVHRLEGGKWIEDSPPGGVGKGVLGYPGCSKTRLSVAGNVLVAIWTDGTRLFASQKPKGGRWAEPREIFNEARGVHHIGAPVRSVENFVPFVWSVKGGAGARFVRIPVQQPG